MRARSSEVRATLHDVAARAQVSIATVSRALNGLPVSTRNQERVQRAAHELGYVANEAARALRNERSHTMGLIFFDLRSTLGVELLDSLSESIEDAGYSLLISTARGDVRRFELLMRRFLERRVDALFCVHARGESETLARYRAAGIPVIGMLTGAGAFAQLPLIGPSIAEASRALARHLAGLGHARAALVRSSPYRPHLLTVGRVLAEQGMHVDELVPSEVGGMRELLRTLLARPERPTAVVAADEQARALLSACAAARIRVPDDLSIVSLGRLAARGRQVSPELSRLTIDPHRLGRAAGAAMLGWLSGAAAVERLQIENGSFDARSTTGPVRAKPG